PRLRHSSLINMPSFLLALYLATAAADVSGSDAATEFFEKNVRPVLVEHCFKCHSATAKSLKGDLRLDTANGLRKGGASGPVVVPGKPNESLLLKAIRYASDELRMPPTGKLPE